LFVEQFQEIIGRDECKFADSPHSKAALSHRPHRCPAEALVLLEFFDSVNFAWSNRHSRVLLTELIASPGWRRFVVQSENNRVRVAHKSYLGRKLAVTTYGRFVSGS
jgi:hypothetical protein